MLHSYLQVEHGYSIDKLRHSPTTSVVFPPQSELCAEHKQQQTCSRGCVRVCVCVCGRWLAEAASPGLSQSDWALGLGEAAHLSIEQSMWKKV